MERKKIISTLLPVAVLTAGLAFVAQAQVDAPDANGATPLRPVEDGADDPRLVPLESTFDAAAWKDRLSDADFGARRRAMRALAAEARSDPGALAALEEWAAAGDDCLAWTAYLTLEEARSAAPQRRADPFHHWFRVGPQGADPFGSGALGGDPFAVRDLMREMRESLDRLPGAQGSQHGLSIETGPDGVRVERRTMVDGDETVETFEADSLEELLELHPELREELSMQPLDPSADMRSLLDRLRLELDLPHSALAPGEVRTDVLGVMMREADAWTGRVDGLEPGTGLYVETVLPGTIAEAVGLRPGDVVARLNGTALRTADDVRGVLDARGADEPLEVEWFDRRGRAQSRTWTP